MNLDPKQTEAFRAVIRTGSFEQAAQRLHLTPPAISQRVRALESALGSALVVRSRPCRPTETGQRLLQYLKRATLLEADLLLDLLLVLLTRSIRLLFDPPRSLREGLGRGGFEEECPEQRPRGASPKQELIQIALMSRNACNAAS